MLSAVICFHRWEFDLAQKKFEKGTAVSEFRFDVFKNRFVLGVNISKKNEERGGQPTAQSATAYHIAINELGCSGRHGMLFEFVRE